jgi:diguanylate cyclase (GGDEF)-like protein
MEKQPRIIIAALFVSTFALFISITVYMERQLNGWMQDRITNELLRNAQTIHNLLDNPAQSFEIDDIDPLIDKLAETNPHRLTIIAADGTVLADSKLTLSEVTNVENHKNRPELLSATEQKPGISVRFSNTIKQDLMYLAIPYQINNSVGFVRVSVSLVEIEQYVNSLRRIQITFAVLGFIILLVIFFLAFLFLHKLNEKNKKKLRKKVKQKTNDLVKIQKFSHVLATCQNRDELAEVVASSAPIIFPQTSGALSITHPSMDHNEVITTWGEDWSGESLYPPTDCWAFRRGVPYLSSKDDLEVSCKHLHSDQTTICVPLLAQSVAIGALHIILKEKPSSATRSQFITMSDHLSLALANINLRESLKLQAIRDPLTNLYNRRYLDEAFENEILRAKRNEHSIGVMMIDIDHFKQFNDSFGHDAGDYTLQLVGTLLTKSIRGDDIACRYGGEEFILVLPNTELETVIQRAEELNQAARDVELTYKDRSLGHISLSIGIALLPQHAGEAESVIAIADKALYQAKTNGRDQFVVATG